MLKNAIERAGSAKDAKKVAEAVKTLPIPKEAVMKYIANDGSAMFDQNGQAYTSNGAFQWQKGKWEFVAELPSDNKSYSQFLRSIRK